MSVEKRLQAILGLPREERSDPLRRLADGLGCSLGPLRDADDRRLQEAELVRRIREAARARREEGLWLVALASAVASALSAAAAWAAVVSR
jgi:hypothetical protein